MIVVATWTGKLWKLECQQHNSKAKPCTKTVTVGKRDWRLVVLGMAAWGLKATSATREDHKASTITVPSDFSGPLVQSLVQAFATPKSGDQASGPPTSFLKPKKQ